MVVIIVAFGVAVLALVPLGLFGLVGGVRDREPKLAIGGLVFLLAAAGAGWGISVVVSVNHEITGSHVARARAVNCTAEILGVRGERARINDTHVYRFRVRVQIPVKPLTRPTAPARCRRYSPVASVRAGPVTPAWPIATTSRRWRSFGTSRSADRRERRTGASCWR